ncbi:MAG: efflux RND transporter periplasmic adaptor subunit [Candidatus Zixiibacteriota bacterium]|nr:MAG: efflux RND transporter periplasmic adaptor subunit [candidate division Zixibacteria bacterium]
MKKKKWILIIGVGVVLVVFIVIALKSNQVKKTKTTVEIARKGEITSIVTATGKVKAQADVEISADVMGRIEELPVKEGQGVKTGQLLVKIDDRSRQMDVAQAKGSLLSAQSAYEKARIELAREKQLFEKGLTSQSSLDIVQNLYDQAHAQVQIYQANLDRAQDQLDKCTIRSPMDGIVTKLNSEKGENVVIGTMNNPGTVIMVVSDLSAIEIEAEVDETDIASIKVGQKVEILLDAFPDTTFRGEVIQVGNSAKASSFAVSDQVTNFLVKILILDKVRNIKPGMTASVDITTDYREDAVRIPAGAVVMRPEGTGREKEDNSPKEGGEADSSEKIIRKEKKEIDGVFICKDGKAKFVPVKSGIRDQQYVEITSGLSEGDSVITGSYRTLRNLKHDEIVDPQKPKFGSDAEQEES